jgi:hypothetical protein
MALGSVSSRIVVAIAVLLIGALACNANLDCSEKREVEGYTFNLTTLKDKLSSACGRVGRVQYPSY